MTGGGERTYMVAWPGLSGGGQVGEPGVAQGRPRGRTLLANQAKPPCVWDPDHPPCATCHHVFTLPNMYLDSGTLGTLIIVRTRTAIRGCPVRVY